MQKPLNTCVYRLFGNFRGRYPDLGGAPNQVASVLGEAGRLYGKMVQIRDDLNDIMAIIANPDWL